MADVLALAQLTHTYREAGLLPRTVLDIPQWIVQSGEQILLRGKSGSGKTTLLNIIAGLLTPTNGTVTVAGQALNALREAKRDRFRAQHIGYVFQTHNLMPFTALENVEMPLAFLGESVKTRRERAREALASVGLADWQNNRPAQLSAGQRLRVAVARALVARPAILLADEPTAALDTVMGMQVSDLLQQVCREQHAVLIVASHDPGLVERFSRVIDVRDTHLIEA